jgi:hypothetical protein
LQVLLFALILCSQRVSFLTEAEKKKKKKKKKKKEQAHQSHFPLGMAALLGISVSNLAGPQQENASAMKP